MRKFNYSKRSTLFIRSMGALLVSAGLLFSLNNTPCLEGLVVSSVNSMPLDSVRVVLVTHGSIAYTHDGEADSCIYG